MSLVVNVVKASGSYASRLLVPAIALLAASTLAISVTTQPVDAKKRYSKQRSAPIAKPKGPLTLVISIGSQRVAVYDGTRKIDGAPISSGMRGHWTPRGVFTILQKNRRHYSNLYGGAPMPNMQRITWSGVAMHAGNLPGYPASHGCIRLPYSFSKRLFGLTRLNTRVVVVSRGQPKPQPISHQNLLKPLPAGTPGQSAAHNSARPTYDGAPVLQNATATAADLAIHPTQIRVDTTPGLHEKPERPTGSALTRSSLLEYREREIIYLENLAGVHRKQRAAAAAKLKAANLEVREAQRNVSTARTAANKLTTTISASNRARYAASRKMQVFMAANKKLKSDEAAQKAAKRETLIEAELMENEAEAEIARKELKDLAPITKELAHILKEKQERRNALLAGSTKTSKVYSATLKALTTAKGAIEHRGKPITVFVSRKTMKLYVRRGWEPLFETDIEIDQPDAPIGTHFFQAYSYTNDTNDLSWNTIRAYRTDMKTKKRWKKKSRKRRRQREWIEETVKSAGLPAQTANNALERIKIPMEIRMRLAELINPDSALVISDNGIGNETGAYTDIIVLTK